MTLRVNQGQTMDSLPRPASAPKTVPGTFQQELTRLNTNNTTEIDRLAQMVNEAGDLLARGTTLGNLNKYKQALKNLLNQVAKSYGLNSEFLFNHQGHRRILTSIHQIENEAEELAKEITSRNPNHLKILTKLDTIKGLLIDLLA